MKNNLKQYLDIAHNELYNNLIDKSVEIQHCNLTIPRIGFIDSIIFEDYQIEQIYNISIALTSKELEYNLSKFTEEIIKPSMYEMSDTILEYYQKIKQPIIIPDFKYLYYDIPKFTKYNNNIGLGMVLGYDICRLCTTLDFDVICGYIIK